MSAEAALSRRSLGGGVVALAVATALTTAGCDAGDGLDLPGLPTGGEEPDREQVLAGLRDERAVLERLRLVQRNHRSLRRALTATADVHQAHVDLLARADDTAGTAAGGEEPGGRSERIPVDPSAALAELVRLERSLAAKHVDTAMASRSGVLARVLASMSAAAAQQAVVLSAVLAGLPGEEQRR